MTDVAERLARKGDRGETPRQMRLQLAHIGVWSTTKLSFILSICLNAVTALLIFLLVQFLSDADVFSGLTVAYQDLTNNTTMDLAQFLDSGTVLAFTGAVILLNTVLITGLGTAYALLFNLAVRVTDGPLVGFRSN